MKPVELERRAAELFKAALDCEPAQRTEYLQRECGGDEPLRAAVEALLVADSAAAGFLEPRWDHCCEERLRTPTAEPRRLGDFEILREIGRGGMGVVYEAQQVSLKRKVALKVLSGQLGLTSQAVARFRREAEAAAKLHHTNIVPIYAIGEQDGTHYYAMELIEGPPLNVVINALRETSTEARSGRHGAAGALPAWVIETVSGAALDGARPEPEASARDPASTADGTGTTDGSTLLRTAGGYFDTMARLIAEVADALDYAHKQGVIHRDIKPSNLLLSCVGPVSNRSNESSATCPAKLSISDFGLARVLEEPGMTVTGDFLGTPRYMSPEQIAAGGAPPNHRTDVYSLGATLYELLTLQPAFPGERREQVLAQIVDKAPASPRRRNRKVPVDLETICLKALEKDPDRRYQTAGQMAEDLRRYVNRFAISARRAGPIARTIKWARRRPAMAGLAAAVLVLVGVAAGSAYHSRLSAQQARIARQQARAAEGQGKLDQAVEAVLCGQWEKVEPLLEQAEGFGIAPGRIHLLRGLVGVETGEIELAIHELQLAIQMMPDSLGAYALLFQAYADAGDYEAAYTLGSKLVTLQPVLPEDYLYGSWAIQTFWPERSLQWLEYLAAEHPTAVAHFYLGRARAQHLADTYDPAEIEPTMNSLEAARAQMPNAFHLRIYAELIATDIYAVRGDEAESQRYAKLMHQKVESRLREQPDSGDSYWDMAIVAAFDGRWEDALRHIRDTQRYGLWPYYRFLVLPHLYQLGRYEEGLSELEALPAALRVGVTPTYYFVLFAAEVRGPAAAEAALKTYEERWGAADWVSRSERYHAYQGYCFLGHRAEAVRCARALLPHYPPLLPEQHFLQSADAYVCAELEETALLAAASNRHERNEAHYLIGVTHLADGDRAAAIEHFTAVKEAGNVVCSASSWNRYTPLWAEPMLERMQNDPTWPPWISVKEDDGTTAQRDAEALPPTQPGNPQP
jgi:serine/threonine protein kinase